MAMAETSSSEKIEVLLVDDRPENLLALETVLSSPEYHLVRANSGDEALRYLLDHEPALILLDVQMPDLDGFETAAIIKRSERTRAIPIIFVTALNQDDRYVMKGYQHGAIDYLYKPYNPEILKSKVAVFAELARKTKSLIQAERKIHESERKDRERQIAQLELRSLKREQMEQKKYLDLVAGITHGIVWSADADSLVVNFVSPSSVKILGYREDEWINESNFLINHISPADRTMVLEHIEKAKSGREEIKLEHRFVTQAGQELWFQTEIKVAPKTEGRGFEIRGLSIDITRMKEAQEVLSQSKLRSDFISEASLSLGQSFDYEYNLEQVGLIVVASMADYFAIHEIEEDGSIKCIVEKYAAKKKWDIGNSVLEELGLRSVFEQNQSACFETVPEKFEVAQNHRVKTAILVPLQAKGQVRFVMTWLSAKIGVHYTSEDLAMAEDLAARATIAIENSVLNHKAEAAVKVRDEFLSVASHELKTPLTPLKLQAQMLTRVLKTASGGELKSEKVDKILVTFDRQLDRLSLLIDELLDISKMTNGKLSLTFEEFDLVDLIKDVLNRFSGQLAGAQCEVTLDCEKEIKVEWDRFRIEQVFINLLTNASKYGHGKPIHIEVKCKDGVVSVSVKDQGIGIAKADLARIFDRFERAVSGKNFAGLGLGLYIVTQLLEAHQGKIKVESELGAGSKFTFSIPVKTEMPVIPLAASAKPVKELRN